MPSRPRVLKSKTTLSERNINFLKLPVSTVAVHGTKYWTFSSFWQFMTQIFWQWCAVYRAFICMCYISQHRITKEFYSNHATYSKLIITPYIVYVYNALAPARQQSREREQWLSRLETASKKELKLIGDPNSSKWSMEGELDFKAWNTVNFVFFLSNVFYSNPVSSSAICRQPFFALSFAFLTTEPGPCWIQLLSCKFPTCWKMLDN